MSLGLDACCPSGCNCFAAPVSAEWLQTWSPWVVSRAPHHVAGSFGQVPYVPCGPTCPRALRIQRLCQTPQKWHAPSVRATLCHFEEHTPLHSRACPRSGRSPPLGGAVTLRALAYTKLQRATWHEARTDSRQVSFGVGARTDQLSALIRHPLLARLAAAWTNAGSHICERGISKHCSPKRTVRGLCSMASFSKQPVKSMPLDLRRYHGKPASSMARHQLTFLTLLSLST